MYQVMWTVEIWLGTRQKSTHSNTAQMTLSMCSSRYCSTFAIRFFLYFWAIIVFWDSLTFSFYFFDIFLHLGAEKKNHKKYEHKQVKGVACGKLKRRAQNWQKAYDHENRILRPVFGQNKIFWTRQSWISIPSTCLSCWPINILSTRCIKWCEQLKYD